MAGSMQNIDWIAVDWGTSNLRVWAMDGQGQVVAEHRSDKGMSGLDRDQFEAALLELIDPWLNAGHITQVICCGMVGSQQGWAEAAYLSVPCDPPNGEAMTRVETRDPRIAVSILPGVKQMAPADVMRGEETQITGFLNRNAQFDGVLCLPGTHTKWVQISAGEIVSFRTFMTGELYALLSEQSVLRHSVRSDGFDKDAFESAVSDAIAQPQALASRLFGLRAGSLVAGLTAEAARAQLSGMLIGAELAAARPYWLGQNVAIVGTREVSQLYRMALRAQGVPATLADVTEMTLTGLIAAHQSMKENAA